MARQKRSLRQSIFRRPVRGLSPRGDKRRLVLHLERLEDRHLMDGAGFVNTDPPEDPDTIVGVAGIEAVDDHRETRRGTIQLRLDPLQNDLLPEGSESLKIKSASATKLGHTVTITEDGRGLLYDAGAEGLQASDTFYYIVESDDGKLGKANISLSLKYQRNGGNTPRYEVQPDYLNIFEDSPEQRSDVLRNDRAFRDGEIIAISLESSYYGGPLQQAPDPGSIRIIEDGKAISYQPSQGFSGSELFLYTVRNENGEEANGYLSIQVRKPVSALSYAQNRIHLDFGTGNDVSRELFIQHAPTAIEPVIEAIDAPEYAGNFSLTSNGKQLLYEPNPEFIGNFVVDYTVRYGSEDYQFLTGQLHYKVENTFLAVDNWFAVDPDGSEAELKVLENDPTWQVYRGVNKFVSAVELKVDSVSAGDQGGQIRVADDGKSIFYQPAEGYVGDETFTYEVLASNGARDTATVTVHVADPVADPSGVDRFVNEAELQQFLIDKAVARYARQFGLTQERYAPIPGTNSYPYSEYVTLRLSDSDSVNLAASSAGSNVTHSETNTQVSGIDEADIVETDGHYIYTFTSGKLVIVDVSDPETPKPVSFTAFDDRFDLMYLQGDRMTLLKNGSMWGGGAEVLVLDISDRTAPTVVERTEIDGHIADSRAIGDRVHLVVKRSFQAPALEGKWLKEPVPPAESPSDKQSVAPLMGDSLIAVDYAYPSYNLGEPGVWQVESLDEYLDRVRDSLIDTGLTSYRTFNAEGELVDSGLLTNATSVHKPVAGSDLLVSLVTIDAGDDAVGPVAAATSFVADANTDVYVSAEAAYVFAYDPTADNSTVYKLSLEENGSTPIVASGVIGGRLLNQFSADEHDGYLRVATTEVRSETIDTTWGRRRVQRQRFNNVLVLEQQGNQLTMVGEVTNLAPTETIHSVRFMGDRAFVVTFRVVDPLFALDMSDPTKPTVEGALKIPGFSNYLHPVGSDYLIGIGRDASEITGRVGPLQITLFNVSDLSDPHVADQLTFEGANWGNSEAWIEHHAVSFFAESGVLAIPIAWSEQIELEGEEAEQYGRYRTENRSAIWTVKVDTASEAASLEVTGSVEHEAASYGRFNSVPIRSGVTDVWWGGWSYDPGSPARRALRVGESLITVSNEYVKINDLHDPSNQLAEVYLGQLTQDDTFVIDEDSGSNVLDVSANDLFDPGSAPSQILDFTQPNAGGTVELSEDGKTLLFTPEQDFFGRVSFTYSAFDEVRGEETATVYVTVNNIPDDPTAVDDEFFVDINSSSTVLNVRENDINPDANKSYFFNFVAYACDCDYRYSAPLIGLTNGLSIVELGEPDQQGTVEIDDWGRLVYTPAEGFEGTETFTYTISNNGGELTDVGTVTVHVGDTAQPAVGPIPTNPIPTNPIPTNPIIEAKTHETVPTAEVPTKTIATRTLPGRATVEMLSAEAVVAQQSTTPETPQPMLESAQPARGTLADLNLQVSQQSFSPRSTTDSAELEEEQAVDLQWSPTVSDQSQLSTSATDLAVEEITSNEQEQLRFTMNEEFSASLAIDLAEFQGA